MIRALGKAPLDCGTWASVRDFFDPSITTSQYAADAYECAQYGSIPTPAAPTPRAPQTQAQMTTPDAWTPADAANTGQDWADATDEQIAQAIAAGTYNPAGNLPVSATWLDAYKWPLILGAAAIGALVLVEAVKLK